MCLTFDQTATDETRQKILAGESTFWKAYGVTEDRQVISPFLGGEVLVAEDGTIVSDRGDVRVSDAEEMYGILQGIHVCFYRNRAECMVVTNRIVVPVTVDAGDLIGADANRYEAVFLKVKVDPAQLREVASSVQIEEDEEDEEDEDDDDLSCSLCGDPDCDGECEDDWDDDEEDDDDNWDEDDDGDWDDDD